MGYDSGIPQHKNSAEGNGVMGGTDFGCKPMDHSKGPLMAPISEGMKGHVGDGKRRGARPPVGGGGGKHPMQAQPDHGPHGRMGSEMP